MQDFVGNREDLTSTLSEIEAICSFQQRGYMILVSKGLFLWLHWEQTI
jgi:hypothetical protein